MRKLKTCSVCAWNGPRREMFHNPGAIYICRNEAACYFRYKMKHADRDADAERKQITELREAAIADIKRRLGIA